MCGLFAVKANAPVFIANLPIVVNDNIYYGKIEARHNEDNVCRYYMHDSRIYAMGLDTTFNVRFWRKVIALSSDSAYLNIASTRQVLLTLPLSKYNSLSETGKEKFRDSLKNALCVPDSERVVLTSGRKHFYLLKEVMADITTAITIFEANGTDPFYAQAIMLIESPGKLQKSTAGAYGPFQLMKSVARNMGLTVNSTVDERKSLPKSALAASRLINRICIPYTNKMLEEKGIPYDANDLWYKLLVLHVYHAGAGNVSKALYSIPDTSGGMDLIKKLWATKYGKFGISSQSYSQVALACLIELDNLIDSHCHSIEFVSAAQ